VSMQSGNGLASVFKLRSFIGMSDFSSPTANVFADGVLPPALVSAMTKERMRSTSIACCAGGKTTRAVEVVVSAV